MTEPFDRFAQPLAPDDVPMDRAQLLELARLCGVLNNGTFSGGADQPDVYAVIELTDAYIREVSELPGIPDGDEEGDFDDEEDPEELEAVDAEGEVVRVLLGGVVARSIFAAPPELLERMHGEFAGLSPTQCELAHALSYIATVSHGPAGILQVSDARKLVCGPDILMREGLWEYMAWRQFPMQLLARYLRRLEFALPSPDTGFSHYDALVDGVVDAVATAENLWIAAENAHVGTFMARQHLDAAGVDPRELYAYMRVLGDEMMPALSMFGLASVDSVCVFAQSVATGAFATERQSLVQELALLSPTVTDVSLLHQSREFNAELAEARRTEAASRARAEKWRKLAQDGAAGPKPKPRKRKPPTDGPPPA